MPQIYLQIEVDPAIERFTVFRDLFSKAPVLGSSQIA
jgi:hypothetical protein